MTTTTSGASSSSSSSTKKATATTTTTFGALQQVVNAQLSSLDDTDPYATAWTAALQSASTAADNTADTKTRVSWGGRGQGGRGRARRTFQPHDIIVDNISLVYPGGGSGSGQQQRILLEDATLKLLASNSGQQRIYALVGANGCGKSSLLRRIHNGSIPGFPPHISTLYLAQEVVTMEDVSGDGEAEATITNQKTRTPSVLDELLARYHEFHVHSTKVTQYAVEDLERRMEDLDLTNPQDQERMEELTEQIAALEEEQDEECNVELRKRAQQAISFMMSNVGNVDKKVTENDDIDWSTVPMSSLSTGLRKKVILATALLCPCDLLLLDEPAQFLDVSGLLQLRRLLSSSPTTSTRTATTILLVSHDIDLINEVATDVIEMRNTNHKLYEYTGCNFDSYVRCKGQESKHLISKAIILDKKQAALQQTLQHIKSQPVSQRGAASKKKGRQIGAHRKKMERVDREYKSHEDELKAASLLHPGSITGSGIVGSSPSSSLPTEKAIQFVFRDPTSQWGEPLIIAFDVGHGYNLPPKTEQQEKEKHHHSPVNADGLITKKEGYLFDYVDLCIEEGETYCILGNNASGKSTLLRILAKIMDPVEGRVKHALNIQVGYLDQELVDSMIQTGLDDDDNGAAQNALSFLFQCFPKKTEQDIRGELTNFGISPIQACTNLCFLSGGERSRICLVAVMLHDPHVLLLDNPTSNLDPDSVEALIHGLRQWKGTLVLVSHDAHLVRSLEAQCHVLMSNEGKLRRVEGGVDAYLRSFVLGARRRTSSKR